MEGTPSYQHSFGLLPDKTVYQNSFHEIDMRAKLKSQYDTGMERAQAELKALTTSAGGTGTAGNALIPV